MKRLILPLAMLAVIASGLLYRASALNTTPCPVSLTNPDGQSLVLEKYDLRVAVHGALSLTEMEMVFRNPENRVMEGRFLYLLPTGATISRFAKEVDGKLMEGEVVERMRAQAIYTEILHTMRDPALLEMDQGNRFSARVFPIPASGTVRLLLSYSQQLPLSKGERKLTIPMLGMPQIGEFSFKGLVRRLPSETVTFTSIEEKPEDSGENATLVIPPLKNFTPQRDIELAFKKKPDAPPLSALKSGNFQMLCWRPAIVQEQRQEVARGLVLYVDTSASNADTEAQRIDAINALFLRLKSSHTEGLSAYAFDVGVKELFNFGKGTQDRETGPEMLSRALRARHALGATNLEAALKHIGEQARAAKDPRRFILITDGIATMGAREARDIVAALGDWPREHELHAVVVGNKQDEKMLAAIVEKTSGRVVTLPLGEEVERNASRIADEIRVPIGQSFEFYDEGADWIYPKSFRDVQPGQELVVFSQLKEGVASKPGAVWRVPSGVKGEAHSQDFKLTPAELPEFAPLLQREACRAFLDHLEKLEQAEKLPAKIAELRKQRVEVSTKNRVLCPLTSLLVLETERDYRRFGIERTALSDVMVIGKSGIELMKRGPETVPLPPPVAKKLKQSEEKSKGAPKPEAKNGHARKADEAMDMDKAPAKDAARGDDPGAGELEGRRRERAQVRGAEALEAESAAQENLARPGDGDGGGQGGAPGRTAGQPPAPMAAAPAPTRELERDSRDANAANDERANSPRRVGAVNAFAANPQQQEAQQPAPDWIKQYNAVPTEAELNALLAQVQAKPRERNLRNACADALFKAGKWDSLQGQAFEWLPFDPENPQVFEYLGKSAAGLNDSETALRAITSIAEIAPNRAALLARAGWLLLMAEKFEMAQSMFREALKNREDDVNIHRGLAYSLWLADKHADAAKVLEDALKKDFNQRYGDVKRVLREELAYVLRGMAAKEGLGMDAGTIAVRAGVDREMLVKEALRVTLCWETDANDVDLHVVDPNNEMCFYSHKQNRSGLELYSDQTQGLGPEVIRSEKALPGIYHVAVKYFSAGPMGVSRGVVVIMQPKDGVVTKPQIVPFCLVPGGPEMRHLGAAKF